MIQPPTNDDYRETDRDRGLRAAARAILLLNFTAEQIDEFGPFNADVDDARDQALVAIDAYLTIVREGF